MQASTPIFDFGEHRFDLGDVILAAVAWDDWQNLERELAVGLACELEAERRGEAVEPEEIRAKVVEFRRSRRLLAGADYLSWLADRSLSPDDVVVHLKRLALRRRVLGGATSPGSGNWSDERTAAVIEREALLTGQLRAWSERLARCAAAHCALGAGGGGDASGHRNELTRLLERASKTRTNRLTQSEIEARAPRIAQLIASESSFRAAVSTSASIERRMAEHSLDWQRVVWTEAALNSEGAAREAALTVREDGLELESVTSLAHGEIRKRTAYLSDVPELAHLLSSAVPGELIGPFESEGRWRLALVRERRGVSLADPVLHDRTADEMVEDALMRHLAGKVCWRAPV